MNEIRERKKKSLPKLLYLDQNQWDRLEKIYYKENEDPLIEEILSKLLSLVKKGKLRIIIDVNRKIETSQREIYESRKRLTDFMIMVSEGYSVLPSLVLEEFEIKNYFNRKLGLQKFNIKDISIGKDIQYLLVGKPSITSDKVKKEDLDKLNRLLEEYISKPEFRQGVFYKFSEKDKDYRQQYVERAEKAREILSTMKSEKQRRDYQTKQNFKVLMRKIMEVYKVTDDFLNKISDLGRLGNLIMIRKCIPQIFDTIKKKRDFIKQFPLFFTHCSLVDFRDRDLNRDIQGNDLIDIVSYVVPIVYFDFVVGEKYFINLAKQAKLDKKYGSVLLRKLSDFKVYLDNLNNNIDV